MRGSAAGNRRRVREPLPNDCHFDDPLFFTSPQTFSSLPSNQSYRPVVTTTMAIDYRLGGSLDPLAFHITSFSLFLVQCALLLVLYRRVMDRAQPGGDNRWLALTRRPGTRCTRRTPKR